IVALVGVAVIVALGAVYLPPEVVNRFFLEKFSGDVINNRISGGFDVFFNHFLTYDGAVALLMGQGADILSNNNLVASDYRGFVIKYGIIGVVLLFLLVFSFLFERSSRVERF